jgi:hypothetical protein
MGVARFAADDGPFHEVPQRTNSPVPARWFPITMFRASRCSPIGEAMREVPYWTKGLLTKHFDLVPIPQTLIAECTGVVFGSPKSSGLESIIHSCRGM